ncbi:hypothetical protein B5M09_009929 [Aphanomyces astaci]|uniref:Uncharacterized protein n=1 Tax=Aphanomyces astaci TaxID=112090 RepID=A0A425D9Z5_APHAT|nr:hypothetical protein B5M09_009929 [Aphanomyces astaci]
MWGCELNDNGEMPMPGPSTKCNDAKPMFDPPGTRSLINQADHDIAMQLPKNNGVGVRTLRLLLFVSRKLGSNPNDLLQPFLGYRDDDSGDFDDGEQPSGDDYGVDGDDNEQGELVPPMTFETWSPQSKKSSKRFGAYSAASRKQRSYEVQLLPELL